MTNEEALKKFLDSTTCFDSDEKTELNDMIYDALKRQIPQKPSFVQYADFSGCKCGMKIYPLMSFCPYCGQSILWE